MVREFDYAALTYYDRLKVHSALVETTLKHIDSSGGLFTSLDFDAAAHPSQMLETVHLAPAPVREGEVAGLASIASPDLFAHAQEVLGKQRAFTSAARLLLEQDGMNIFPVSNHGNIKDIAIWSAAWSEHLDQGTWQQQNGLIISRGVTTIGAFGMAASEVVEKAGHVFMSFPRTRTIEQLDIDQRLVDTNNRNMRREVHHWIGEDLFHKVRRQKLGKTLNIAWSGKTDEIERDNDGRPEGIQMGVVSKGTLDIVKRGLVLPIVIWESDEPVLEIGELTRVDNVRDVRRVQKWQCETLADALGISKNKITVAD